MIENPSSVTKDKLTDTRENDLVSREEMRQLEARLNNQARNFRLASEVSQQLTTTLEFDELLRKVTELLADTFGLYYAAIFLYDSQTNWLVLRQGTGSAGQLMMAAGKHYDLRQSMGIVPSAARSLKAVLANNVMENDHYLPNPMLPETMAQLAVPMVYQGNLLGVLDLRSDEAYHYQADDVALMTTLAAQVAVAVHNAKLFGETQAARLAAERANEVKSAFLASMSHELRTPLNAVINFTQFVVDGDTGEINDQQQDLLSEVIKSAKHLLDLINDVLDMSKIEAGSLSLFIEDQIKLDHIVSSALLTAQGLLGHKQVSIKRIGQTDMPTIRGDYQRILQVLLNILSNACKFTEAGEIVVNTWVEKGEVLISVKDNGPGIVADDQHLVFEAFKQTKSGIRKGGGTGLGMPIAKNLVEAHGGRLWLESEAGQGATFFIALPIRSDRLVPIL